MYWFIFALAGSGRVTGHSFRLRCGSGRVQLLLGRMGSGPKKVTRVQLWTTVADFGGCSRRKRGDRGQSPKTATVAKFGVCRQIRWVAIFGDCRRRRL